MTKRTVSRGRRRRNTDVAIRNPHNRMTPPRACKGGTLHPLDKQSKLRLHCYFLLSAGGAPDLRSAAAAAGASPPTGVLLADNNGADDVANGVDIPLADADADADADVDVAAAESVSSSSYDCVPVRLVNTANRVAQNRAKKQKHGNIWAGACDGGDLHRLTIRNRLPRAEKRNATEYPTRATIGHAPTRHATTNRITHTATPRHVTHRIRTIM